MVWVRVIGGQRPRVTAGRRSVHRVRCGSCRAAATSVSRGCRLRARSLSARGRGDVLRPVMHATFGSGQMPVGSLIGKRQSTSRLFRRVGFGDDCVSLSPVGRANIDMTLAQLLGDRPRAAERPDMRALLRWFVQRKRSDERSEAVFFVDVPAEASPGLKRCIAFLTSIGYRVYAKPKESYASDVDEAMVAYIESVTATAGEIIVASNDARRFTDPLKSVAQAGVGATRSASPSSPASSRHRMESSSSISRRSRGCSRLSCIAFVSTSYRTRCIVRAAHLAR